MKVEFVDEIESTNTELVNRGHKEQDDTVLVAFKQTKGKGRRGRSFYSPAKSGLYMSFLVHPAVVIEDAFKLTTLVAVAACKAIEQLLSVYPLSEGKTDDNVIKIKWVNDLYKDNKKISGILTECSSDITNGKPKFLVAGIGINLFTPKGGFPDDIKDRAGAIYSSLIDDIDELLLKDIKEKLAYLMIEAFNEYYSSFPLMTFSEEYKRRSFLVGRYVDILNGPRVLVKGIDDELGLVVEHEDGRGEILTAGEVSLII